MVDYCTFTAIADDIVATDETTMIIKIHDDRITIRIEISEPCTSINIRYRMCYMNVNTNIM